VVHICKHSRNLSRSACGVQTAHAISAELVRITHQESSRVQACLELDYEVGLNVRDAPWPNLRAGLAAEEPLPWDLLFALALVDARSGGGGGADPFWAEYVAALLPAPESLTLPFCQPGAALAALQHPRVAAAAAAQQARLAGAFPRLAAPAAAAAVAHPTLLEWGLACVRSRAFQLGPSRFAYVPFLDCANHAVDPNADFRAAPDAGAVELVATGDLKVGDEVTLSYTGPGGATNRRLLVQYGFVHEENPADRLDLGLTQGYISPKPLRGSPCALTRGPPMPCVPICVLQPSAGCCCPVSTLEQVPHGQADFNVRNQCTRARMQGRRAEPRPLPGRARRPPLWRHAPRRGPSAALRDEVSPHVRQRRVGAAEPAAGALGGGRVRRGAAGDDLVPSQWRIVFRSCVMVRRA
jgi:SET domain